MLAGLLALAILVVRLFPETPFARFLHLWLVELPVDLARRIERRHVILVVIILCFGQTLALAGSAELAFAFAADMSLYADAALAAYLASVAVRLKAMRWACRDALQRIAARLPRPRRRSPRTRPSAPRTPKPGNDDDPAWRELARAA